MRVFTLLFLSVFAGSVVSGYASPEPTQPPRELASADADLMTEGLVWTWDLSSVPHVIATEAP